jgi:hypothetical protein
MTVRVFTLPSKNVQMVLEEEKKKVVSPCENGLEYLHRSRASRKRRYKGKPSARGYNWTLGTLIQGDTNTGTWPSKFGQFQMRQ